MTMKMRLLASLAGIAAAFIGLAALLHTPFGRPLLRRLGVACPATKVSPGQVEAVRLRAVAALRGERPSPARPALGQALDLSRPAEVAAWARVRGLACVESMRPVRAVKCTGPGSDQIAFAFAPDGRLVSVDRLRGALNASEASRLFGQVADDLAAALGPGQVAGDATPDYLASGSMHSARLAYRFSDYLATVTAMNVAGRVVLHEQYESARGG
jgi:hypothetical protein